MVKAKLTCSDLTPNAVIPNGGSFSDRRDYGALVRM